MRHFVAVVVLAATTLGCASNPTATHTLPPAHDSTTAASQPGTADTMPGASTSPAAASAVPVGFDVDAATPPDAMVEAIRAAGGVLITNEQWSQRFGLDDSMPMVDAPLIEAATERHEDRSVEERTWIVTDRRDRYDLVNDFKTVLGLNRVADADNYGDTTSECTQVRANAGDIEWTLRACDYPAFPDLHALGVVRSSPATGDVVIVADTVTTVLEATATTPTDVVARLQIPVNGTAAPLSVSTRATTRHPIDPSTVAGELIAGPLPGWALAVTADAANLTGPRGEVWTITDTVAQFNQEAQW